MYKFSRIEARLLLLKLKQPLQNRHFSFVKKVPWGTWEDYDTFSEDVFQVEDRLWMKTEKGKTNRSSVYYYKNSIHQIRFP